MVKKFCKMAVQYQLRIDRQRNAIDRLAAANAVYGDALYQIINEAASIRSARKIAEDAAKKVQMILTVPNEEE